MDDTTSVTVSSRKYQKKKKAEPYFSRVVIIGIKNFKIIRSWFLASAPMIVLAVHIY